LSSRAQKLAAVPEATFEAELAAKRERDQREGARVSARLEQAGARELAKQKQADYSREFDDDGTSAADLLDEMQRDLQRAEARVAELEKALQSDGKEASVNLARRLDHAVRQQETLQEDASRLQRKADRYEKMLAQIGNAIGQPDLDRVVDAVRVLARASKGAAQ
jgi:predicted phage-related endonuclease